VSGDDFTDPLERGVKDAFSKPTPLNLLCAACFGSNPRAPFGVFSFDACMQQTSEGRTSFNPTDEYKDQRILIDHALYEVDNLDDVEVKLSECKVLTASLVLQHVHLNSKPLPIPKARSKCLIPAWSLHVAVTMCHYGCTTFGGQENEWSMHSAVF
jgi:hypothetical protein